MHDSDHTSPDHEFSGKPASRARGLVIALVLVGTGAVAGSAGTTAFNAFAHGGGRADFGHGRHSMHMTGSVDQARERAADGAAWVIGAVDATAEQKLAIRRITEDTVDGLFPLMQTHRDNRRQMIELLARPDLDADALERLRRAELDVIDAASASLAGALTDTAAVLSPEQRQQLLAMAGRFRH